MGAAEPPILRLVQALSEIVVEDYLREISSDGADRGITSPNPLPLPQIDRAA